MILLPLLLRLDIRLSLPLSDIDQALEQHVSAVSVEWGLTARDSVGSAS